MTPIIKLTFQLFPELPLVGKLLFAILITIAVATISKAIRRSIELPVVDAIRRRIGSRRGNVLVDPVLARLR